MNLLQKTVLSKVFIITLYKGQIKNKTLGVKDASNEYRLLFFSKTIYL
jgi:hypothetical protein